MERCSAESVLTGKFRRMLRNQQTITNAVRIWASMSELTERRKVN